MNLARPSPPRAIISLVPLVDVLLIMLVFFMVTSTYLNLDMIPAVQRQDDPAAGSAPPLQVEPDSVRQTGAIVVRIGADGRYYLRGQPQSAAALAALWRDRVAADPAAQVLVLPSPRADLQALVTLMDTATAAGIARLSVIRLEAAP
jgi:biopolymer transport protein ExbD